MGSGGGSGQGGINYVLNPDAETDTSDTSVTSNITLTRLTNTNRLRGDGSFNYTIGVSAVTGNYGEWSLDTFDYQDQGKMLYVSFDYSTTSTFVADDLKVVIRDNTNASDIDVRNGEDGIIVGTNGS